MRRLVAVLALVFFFVPVGLRVVGVHSHPFENRRLAGPPKLSQGWDAFGQGTRFFVDRMPLREQAVRANTWVSLNVFDTTPDYGAAKADRALPFGAPSGAGGPKEVARTRPGGGKATEVQPGADILKGRDGWFYLEGELARACQYFISWSKAIRRYERLVSIIRASGRRVVFAIPPDKSTIYPEYLPSSFAEKACLAKGRRLVWRTIEGTSDRDVLGLRKAMLAVKAKPPEETYYPTDSHWNTKGGVLALRAILQHLGGPAQVRDADIRKGRAKATGDATKLLGAPAQAQSPYWTIQRDVAPVVESAEPLPGNASLKLYTRAPGGAPLIPGRTVFVYDSFGQTFLDALSRYTTQLATILWFENPPEAIIEAIARARTVVLLKVERDANFFASDQGVFTPAFLAHLSARLRKP
jgi:alginate O-acetyltransferase complex protein AlgJ